MVTGAQISAYLDQVRAEHHLAGNTAGERNTQLALDVLAGAAAQAGGGAAALTGAQLLAYVEQLVSREYLDGSLDGLKNAQAAAGMLMAAAENAGDKDTAFRLRTLAAQAANKREELAGSK